MKIVRRVSTAAAIVVGVALSSITLSACTFDENPSGVASTAPTSLAGRWTAPDGTGETRITLDESGGATGFDGCNTHTGSFHASGAGIALSFTSATEVACSKDVWLQDVTSAHLDGGDLIMTAADGEQLGRLHKTES